MSTFYYLWRASDAARNLDLLMLSGFVILQFACNWLIGEPYIPITKTTIEKIYVLLMISLDLYCAIITGLKASA